MCQDLRPLAFLLGAPPPVTVKTRELAARRLVALRGSWQEPEEMPARRHSVQDLPEEAQGRKGKCRNALGEILQCPNSAGPRPWMAPAMGHYSPPAAGSASRTRGAAPWFAQRREPMASALESAGPEPREAHWATRMAQRRAEAQAGGAEHCLRLLHASPTGGICSTATADRGGAADSRTISRSFPLVRQLQGLEVEAEG